MNNIYRGGNILLAAPMQGLHFENFFKNFNENIDEKVLEQTESYLVEIDIDCSESRTT